MNIKRISAIAALGLVLSTTTALAAVTTKEGEDTFEMHFGNDLFSVGNSVNVSQPAADDVFAAGNRVMVTGDVRGDINAAGSDVILNGIAHDDVRVFAGNVRINGNIEGDVMVFGGTLYIARDSNISGSILGGGGEITLDGTVEGDVNIDGGSIALNGTVNGNVEIKGEHVTVASLIAGNSIIAAQAISLNDGTNIRGDLRYWQDDGQLNTTGKVMGTATLDNKLERTKPASETEVAGLMATLLATVTIFGVLYAALTIGVFMLITRTIFIESAKKLNAMPGWSILIGFLYFILTPFAILLLMITLIGIPLGLTLFSIYIFSLFFAKVIASIVLTRWCEARGKKKWHPAAVYFGALGMYILLSLIGIIPFVGWLAVMIVVVASYGAFEMVKFERVKKIM